jgi:hypothetical protein
MLRYAAIAAGLALCLSESSAHAGKLDLMMKLGSAAVAHGIHYAHEVPTYSVRNWTLTLTKPVHFKLPGGGSFEVIDIDLKKPGALVGGALCIKVKGCGETVESLRAGMFGQKGDED